MNTVVVPIMGGLGNQFFQYAFGRALQHHNQSTTVLYDISFFGKNTPNNYTDSLQRQFLLTKFKTVLPIFSGNKRDLKVYQVGKFFYSPELMKVDMCENYVFSNGYFQSEKYFSDIASTIRSELQLTDEEHSKLPPLVRSLQEEIDEAEISISIHIRRGDYATPKLQPLFGLLKEEYYISALQYIIDSLSLSLEKVKIFLFHDRVSHEDNILCNITQYVRNKKMRFVVISDRGINNYLEHWLMQRCKHNIIANSSFSWWAAWLNNNPNKIVVAPKKWFDKLMVDSKYDIHDLIPSTWKII